MNKIAPPLRNLTASTIYIGVDQINGGSPLGDTRARIIWKHFEFFFFFFKSFRKRKKRFPEGSFLSLHASFVMDLREAPSLNDGSFTGDISGWSNPGGPTVVLSGDERGYNECNECNHISRRRRGRKAIIRRRSGKTRQPNAWRCLSRARSNP